MVDQATIEPSLDDWEEEFEDLFDCLLVDESDSCVFVSDMALKDETSNVKGFIKSLRAKAKAEGIAEGRKVERESILSELIDRELDMAQDDFRTGFRYAMTFIENAIKEGE